MPNEIQTYNPGDFAQVMQIIELHRTQAVQAVNHASLLTAWEVGAFVSDRIKNAQWGAKVVQQLAEYIHTQNPTLKGWSRANIYKMVHFYEMYTSVAFIELIDRLKLNKQLVPTPLKQFVSSEVRQIRNEEIVSFEMRQIPALLMKTGWTYHQIERRSNENPSIGILMCKDANPEVVRYALNRSMSPTMVAKYEEQLKVGSVLQRSLEEFVGFLDDK